MSNHEFSDDIGEEIIPPDPAALIETFRAIGYNLPAAIADIIDNSISAGAKNVWISFNWAESSSSVIIRDDGNGMTKKVLIEAMRPGTVNPLIERSMNDLGRFGLGLKTASFSQCRRLCVISKNNDDNEINYRAWDLDYVEKFNKWQIVRYLPDEKLLHHLERNSGTLVIWELLDRIIYDQDKQLISPKKFWETVRAVDQHLGMVFHRFIDRKKIVLWLNETPVRSWDPFLITESGTQSFPTEFYDKNKISLTGFVLPHSSKISAEKWNAAAGIRGWTAQQGFYIYRKDRILLAGDWLGLYRNDEHTRLARIMVEIDSALDFSWQIDIKKSMAVPPKMFQDILKRYGAAVRKHAIDVYRYRGKQKQRKAGRANFEFAWVTYEENGREYFKINRNHPMVRILADSTNIVKADLERLLRLIEITLPVPAIVLNESQHSDKPADSVISVDDDEILGMMKAAKKKLVAGGMSSQKAITELFFIDPFSNYPHLVEQLK